MITLQFTIQYVDDKAKPPRYLRLDDDHYKIDVINGLPDPEVSGFMDPKCEFYKNHAVSFKFKSCQF